MIKLSSVKEFYHFVILDIGSIEIILKYDRKTFYNLLFQIENVKGCNITRLEQEFVRMDV